MNDEWEDWEESLEQANKDYENALNDLIIAKADYVESPCKSTRQKLKAALQHLEVAQEARDEVRAEFEQSFGT